MSKTERKCWKMEEQKRGKPAKEVKDMTPKERMEAYYGVKLTEQTPERREKVRAYFMELKRRSEQKEP